MEKGSSRRRLVEGARWPDVRGWVAVGMFALTVFLLLLMRNDAMRGDEFFQTIATVIIANGLMAVVGWAFSDSVKEKNTQDVRIKQPANDPVPTTSEASAEPTSEEKAPWDKQ